MRITFVVMGWENPSIEYLSSYLKQNGHEVRLAYDQSLFDDKNYLCIPFAARILNQGGNIVKQVLDTDPDIVAFSVMVVTYQWALAVAEEIKKHIDVPVIFGGYHAISCPERIISKSQVDIVCTGEGEVPLAELLSSMEKGGMDYSIRGLWFKDPSGVVLKNSPAPPIVNLDLMPLPDKDLFAPFIPIKNYYLAVTNRGCPYSCSYCSVSYAGENGNGKVRQPKVRERSVDSVIVELKSNMEKFNYRWVDFRNAVFSSSHAWVLEFCAKYPREVGVPFRIFSHPLLIREDTTIALRDAGCFAIQVGLESYDPKVRNQILNRPETNEDINRAIAILEKHKARYSLDYILGLPGQGEEELKRAAVFFSGLKYCYRISPFMLSFLPKLKIVEHAIQGGLIPSSETERIEEGFHGNYMDKGSDMPPEKRRMFEMYKLLFRSMSFMPSWIRKLFYRSKAYYLFKVIPFDFILRIFDLSMVIRDYDAQAYAQNYWWWFKIRFNPEHPNYYRNLLEREPAPQINASRKVSGVPPSPLRW